MKMSSACNSSICIWLGTDHLTCRVGDYGFFFHSEIFFGQHESQNIYFFFVQSAIFFYQKLTLGYMSKTQNHIIFFSPPPKSEYFFSNIGNQNIFFRKKTQPPVFPVCQSFETFTWLTVSASKLNLSQISFYSLGAAIFNSPTYV